MSDEEEKGTDKETSLSGRAIRRQRRLSAAIVADAVRDLRPQAPLGQVRRLVAERCVAAGLPMPSRNALVAKIADIHRADPDATMLVLDRCFIETDIEGEMPKIATLHVAILHPPGRILAYRLIGGPPEAAIDAELLLELQSTTRGGPSARVRLAASGPVEEHIRAALMEARITVASKTSRWRGQDAKDALGGSLLPHRVRLRAPRLETCVSWAGPRTVRRLSSRLDAILDHERTPQTAGTLHVSLAAPHRAPTLISMLRRILHGRRNPSRD